MASKKYMHAAGSEVHDALQYGGNEASRKEFEKFGEGRIKIDGSKLYFIPYPTDPGTEAAYQPPDEEIKKGWWLMKLAEGGLHLFNDEDFKNTYVDA